MLMNAIELKLCDIQGRLFVLALKERYNSVEFIRNFMRSKVARELDSTYNPMQWMGEEYLLEEFADECPETRKYGLQFDLEVMYWSGYIYRYWHYMTGESSRAIYRQASAKTMNINYLMFHTMDPYIAVEDLKELYRQKTERQ